MVSLPKPALVFVALVALVAAAALAGPAPAAPRDDEDEMPARLVRARDLIGVDAGQARDALEGIRNEAAAAGRTDWRLAADEIECRLLADSETGAALVVADAGIASAAASDGDAGRIRPALFRLRACRAGVLIEDGKVATGEAELEKLLAEAAPEADAGRALARLERGIHRSRSGALLLGQADLLAACDALSRLGLPRDLDLCLGHLANHYKRMGDSDEALRLLTGLVERARARGARIDESIYLFSIAQVHHQNERWDPALRFYLDAERLSESLGDRAGIAYAEYGIGAVQLEAGRPREAAEHLQRAQDLLEPKQDPKQAIRTRLELARALTALHQPERAMTLLAAIDAAVDGFRDDALRGQWLAADAEAHAQAGRWERAYRSLAAWRAIDTGLQAQRLSEHAGRLRMRFNRERDAAELRTAQQLGAQAERLRQAQGIALGLFVVVLLAILAYATGKVRQARRLRELASTDELTGLANRRAVLGFLGERLAADATGLSVLMIDVDHFKRINDRHGHAIGDDALRHLAARLAAGLRGGDRLGRLGGEEFLAVLPGASIVQARAIAERMRRDVAAGPIPTSAGPLAASVSIGVSASAGRGGDAARLIAEADAALYAAKASGRNAVATAKAAIAGTAERAVAALTLEA